MENQMFCYQCQETAGGRGCTIQGMCGKSAGTAHLQDVLIYVTKGLAEVCAACRREGHAVPSDTAHLIEDNLFVTITNANFDDSVIDERIKKTVEKKRNSAAFCQRTQPFLQQPSGSLPARPMTTRKSESLRKRMKISAPSVN